MTGSELAFVDTNILIYCFDSSDTKKKNDAFLLIKKLISEKTLCFSNQILAEFAIVSTKKLKLDSETARKIIDDLFQAAHIYNYTEKTILSALDISKKDNISFWDALIVATMLENKITIIYTENTKDFLKCKQISVINPCDAIH